MTALNPSLQNTLDSKKARKLDHHIDGIYSNSNIKGGYSRTNGNNSIFNSINAGGNQTPAK